jgi:hypothetical protein
MTPTDLFAISSANRNSMLEVDQKWADGLAPTVVCRCGRVLEPDAIEHVVIPTSPRKSEGFLAGADVRVFAIINELLKNIDNREVVSAFHVVDLTSRKETIKNWSALIPKAKRQLLLDSHRRTVPDGTSGCDVCGRRSCYEDSDFFLGDADWPRDGDVFSGDAAIIVSGRILEKLKQASGFRKHYGISINPIEHLNERHRLGGSASV